MLMGEHAVLQGKMAISCAVNKRIKVTYTKRDDDEVIINSNLGSYSSNIKNLQQDPRFRFVLACLEYAKSGLELTIESEFSHEVGLGSSAAVVVATLGCLLEKSDLFEESVRIVRGVQGIASGADVAASVHGGIVFYRMQERVENLATTLPLTLIYSGSKLATKEVIKRVQESKTLHPELFDAIFNAQDRAAQEAKKAIEKMDYEALGRLFNVHHGLQEALGTCNYALSDIVHTLREHPNIYGAKISGSGLGDCAIGLGRADITSKYEQIPVEVSTTGVQFL